MYTLICTGHSAQTHLQSHPPSETYTFSSPTGRNQPCIRLEIAPYLILAVLRVASSSRVSGELRQAWWSPSKSD